MKKLYAGVIMLIVISMLSACNLPNQQAEETTDPNVVFTAAALTVQAQLAQNTPIPAVPTTALQEPTNPPPTAEPTSAPQPSQTPNPTATSIPCDLAKFVEDVTIPDDTVFLPNTTFTKTWRIKNEGTCTWTTGYALVFDSGNNMGGAAAVTLPSDVAPGQSIDLSINLKAPAEPNTYTGNWKLRNSSGVIFGLTTENKPFWVKIKVQEATSAPFAVTSASFTMIPATYTGVCPFPITLTGKITTSGAGQVTYTYRRADGFVSDPMVINFDSAGEKNLVDYTMPMGAGPGFVWSGDVWLYIDNPNHQEFSKKVFTINCLAP